MISELSTRSWWSKKVSKSRPRIGSIFHLSTIEGLLIQSCQRKDLKLRRRQRILTNNQIQESHQWQTDKTRDLSRRRDRLRWLNPNLSSSQSTNSLFSRGQSWDLLLLISLSNHSLNLNTSQWLTKLQCNKWLLRFKCTCLRTFRLCSRPFSSLWSSRWFRLKDLLQSEDTLLNLLRFTSNLLKVRD